MENRFCKNCGTELFVGAKFCAVCGSSVEGAMSVESSIQERRNYSLPKEVIFRGIIQRPLVEFVLDSNGKGLIESGAMVYHNDNVRLEGKLNNKGEEGLNGVLKGVGRSIVSGETMFITEVYVTSNEGRITIAPPTEEKIVKVDVGKKQWYMNDGAFLASTSEVGYNIKSQNMFKAIWGGTGGLFIQETYGEGQLFFSAYRDIEEIDFDESKGGLVIDNEYIVAWQNTLDYSIETASGNFGLMSGEGTVLQFHGKEKIFIQTRSFNGLKQKIATD